MNSLLAYMQTFSSSQTDNTVIEWAPFTVSESVTTEQFLNASEKIQNHFLNKQTGFIKRELLHDKDKKWIDMIYWASKEDAEKAFKKSEQSELCKLYFSLMDKPELDDNIKHLSIKESWVKNSS